VVDASPSNHWRWNTAMCRKQLNLTRKVSWFMLGAALSVIRADSQTPVTVAQLREYLSSKHVAQASDAEVADRLGSVLLTEQLTTMTLNEIQARTVLGPRATEQLALLAAESILKVPPATELPSLVAPDLASQREIAGRAVAYVDQAVHHLPDFLATRVTISFDDMQRPSRKGSRPKAVLHFMRETRHEIAYRNHQEASTAVADDDQPSLQEVFSTWGEFGPVLNMVLSPSFKDSLVWNRWQKDQDGGIVAVYRYTVPRAASHYAIDLCCYVHFHDRPGYHGEIYIVPSSGAIERITAAPEYGDDAPIEFSGIAIQYGHVDLGGRMYICPIRSVGISAIRIPDSTSDSGFVTTRFVNMVRFVNYHKFGSSSRIVPFGGPKPD
jgi:hypothetical protein